MLSVQQLQIHQLNDNISIVNALYLKASSIFENIIITFLSLLAPQNEKSDMWKVFLPKSVFNSMQLWQSGFYATNNNFW